MSGGVGRKLPTSAAASLIIRVGALVDEMQRGGLAPPQERRGGRRALPPHHRLAGLFLDP